MGEISHPICLFFASQTGGSHVLVIIIIILHPNHSKQTILSNPCPLQDCRSMHLHLFASTSRVQVGHASERRQHRQWIYQMNNQPLLAVYHIFISLMFDPICRRPVGM